jgi:L-lactate dehydrogenase
VGHAVASALVAAKFARRLVLLSRTSEQTAACAADVQDMAGASLAPVTVYAASTVAELHDCDAIVVAVRATSASRSGLDVVDNAEVLSRLGRALRGYPGGVLVVTEPVDLMARLLAEVSGAAVYGVGAGLDTARYRALLGAAYRVPARRVEGLVIGEHGDNAVCCLSTTRIGTEPVDPDDPRTQAALAAFAARATAPDRGAERLRAGIAGAVLSALRAAVSGEDALEPLSTRFGTHGWLGQPVAFTNGHSVSRLPALSDAERKQFGEADQKLRDRYVRIYRYLSTLDCEEALP